MDKKYMFNTKLESIIFEKYKEQLIMYGYACGNYDNKCQICEEKFIGDKRARSCIGCAIKSIFESDKFIEDEKYQKELCKKVDESNLLLVILHDALREYYPKKEMSNYQKIIFAIDKLKNINKE